MAALQALWSCRVISAAASVEARGSGSAWPAVLGAAVLSPARGVCRDTDRGGCGPAGGRRDEHPVLGGSRAGRCGDGRRHHCPWRRKGGGAASGHCARYHHHLPRVSAAAMPARSSRRVARFDTLHLRLLKLATRVVEWKTKIMLHPPSACPDQAPCGSPSSGCRTLSSEPRCRVASTKPAQRNTRHCNPHAAAAAVAAAAAAAGAKRRLVKARAAIRQATRGSNENAGSEAS